MGIVYYGCISLGRVYRVQTAVDAVQRTHHYEYVFRVLAKHNSCTVNGEQIAYVELADEVYAHLMSVHFKIHSFKVTLYNACLEVGY